MQVSSCSVMDLLERFDVDIFCYRKYEPLSAPGNDSLFHTNMARNWVQ